MPNKTETQGKTVEFVCKYSGDGKITAKWIVKGYELYAPKDVSQISSSSTEHDDDEYDADDDEGKYLRRRRRRHVRRQVSAASAVLDSFTIFIRLIIMTIELRCDAVSITTRLFSPSQVLRSTMRAPINVRRIMLPASRLAPFIWQLCVRCLFSMNQRNLESFF